MKSYSFQAMGSRILVAMDTDSGEFGSMAGQVAGWFEEWEQIFSRFRLTSELNEVNRTSGRWTKVSETFWTVMQISLENKKLTHGLVTPEALNALEAAGYSVSFEEMANQMDSLLRQPITQSEGGEIELDEGTRSIRLPQGSRIDLGGVVKGWAAWQSMLRLQEFAPVLVDAGGDIAISGTMDAQQPWPVGVTDPQDANRNTHLLMVGGGGLATSGRDYRKWQRNGRWQHHIIDPRINRPAETDILSATIFAKDLVTAEAYAKMAMILGSEFAKPELETVSGLAYLFVLEDGTQISNYSFDEMVWNERWINQQKQISA
jgi:thiamine biosynthesis lipoprotein